jgi:biopolymer transport protein ExbB
MGQFFEFVKNHWYFAIPMIFMSIGAITMVIWRLLLNMNAQTNLNEFLPMFSEKLDKENVDGALRLCRTRTDVIPRRLFVAGLETSKQGTSAMRRAMANAIELEILPDLNFLLPPILAIAKIATMVGLLGTVISMIGPFSKIATGASATDNAKEIGLALFATALGLVTAIPLVFTHVLFKAWVVRFELKMKSAGQKLLLLVQAKKSGASVSTAAAAASSTTAATAGSVGVPSQPASVQAVRR